MIKTNTWNLHPYIQRKVNRRKTYINFLH
uniref:Uncharacterized protein n=1 Tax=Arundo donax TaxID=35708 RepID=A0A0A9GQH4_ARUDO